ncbi:MAG: GTP-binding protein [bacterium]|nr:GTP-binding protein [bacterium]
MTEVSSQENRVKRPPVIAIMGHIDHGKSSLLDYIRKTNITEKEVGGITQHIGAYEVVHEKEGKREKITFLDTPGHEAFRGTRSRGASVADIAILIVSGEDGVRPQTLEVLENIRSSKIPYLVAITKIDKPSADVERIKQNLAENDIYVEGYGGDVPVVAVSAVTGVGVPELLETLLLMSGLENFTGNAEENGSGIIVEAKLDPKKGVTATGIIKDGTVRRGMFAGTKGAIAPLRFLIDAGGNMQEELTFSSPVQLVGWNNMPEVGAEFRTFLKKNAALEFSSESGRNSEVVGAPEERVKTDAIPSAEARATLPIVIKADTGGSLEAIKYEIGKLERERIIPNIVLSGVGSVNENDVKASLSTPGTTVFGFNTKVDSQASALAERNGIPVQVFNIIYELTDKVNQLLNDREPRIEVEEVKGRSKVLKIFSINKDKQVIGAKVLEGTFDKGAKFKVVRREAEIGKGVVKELQQAKATISSVGEGTEFGAMVDSKVEIAPGDALEAYTLVTK